MSVQQGSERSKPIGVLSRTLERDGAEPTDGRAARQKGGQASTPESKLALLEDLLLAEDVTACATRAMEWLFERGRVKHAICMVLEPDQGRLTTAAAKGLQEGAARDFSIDLGDRDDPLAAALAGDEPVTFRKSAGREPPWTPFGSASFVAFPLSRAARSTEGAADAESAKSAARSTDGEGAPREARPGLLLTNPVSSQVAQDIRWLAGMLGPQLARLLDQNAPARAYELDLKVRAATAALLQHNELLNQQNELLNQQRLALEQASSAKSQFLANMSHEFRTPLNAILGYTSMLLQGMGGELTPQQTQMLTRVDSNGKNLLSLINDILDISRIEAGKMPVHFGEFRVSDIVPELLAELDPMIARSKLAVETDLGQVPLLRSDRQKVKQILLNLITNALKFTPKGSVTIATAYDAEKRTITASVIDTGIGISEADQAKLFSDFQQADSSPTRQYGGAGLGLSICRRLAAMLGGRITLESKVGEGSTFTLVLPRQARHRS
jgi:signal transduction histidine kinase